MTEDLPYTTIPLADNEQEVRRRHAANRLAWNEGADMKARRPG